MLNLALIAHCPKTGNIGGLAYADRRAIGSRLLRVHHGEGVAACLGVANPLHFDWCFAALQRNITPEEALITSRLKDPEAQYRQLLLIDREGIPAIRTGKKVPAQSDQIAGPHFAAGGTGLRHANTVTALADGFLETEATDLPLENRLLGALEAVELHGVTLKSEPQSASIIVYGQESYPLVDLRVDCSDRPIPELRRLVDRFHDEVRRRGILFPSKSDFGATDAV